MAPGCAVHGIPIYESALTFNTGTGAAPENVHKVFEPFFTTKEVGKGSGLGLSQVYGFAQQTGGVATIESKLGESTSATPTSPRSPRTCSS